MSVERIKGQEEAIATVKRALQQKKIAHSYIFSGPAGIGKTSVALGFAKLLNCANGNDLSCDECSSCRKIDSLTHPDLFFVDREDEAASISIGQIRRLQQRLSLKPSEAKYKVIIIVKAEHMNDEAANCLLKILEEPTPDTVFILTVSNQLLLPRTILSRCQIIRFRPLTREVVRQILTEGFSVDETQAGLLAALSGCNVERALSLKEKDAIAWKNSILDMFISSRAELTQQDIVTLGKDRQAKIEAIDILMGFYRDLLVYKFTHQADMLINIDRVDTITDMAQKMDTVAIQRGIKGISDARGLLEANVNVRLTLRGLQESLSA